MKEYGVVFNKIYFDEGVILYEAVDVKSVEYNMDTDCYYDDLDNEYIPYNCYDAAVAPIGTRFIGDIKTIDEIKQDLPESENDNDALSSYLTEKEEYLYLVKLISYDFEEEEEPTFEVVPLNISFLTTLGEAENIMECISGSIDAKGKTIYKLEDETIDRLLKINKKEDLINELKKIKSLGDMTSPEKLPNPKTQPNKEISSKTINVKELYDILTKRVINQESAIKDIVSVLATDQYSKTTAERTRCLLVGPTGCGKSEIIRTIANYLDKPVVHIDSTQLTSQGYVGRDIEDFLVRLIDKAHGDIKKAENGILVLDEIDKKGSSSNGDVSGRGVLNMLLQLLDGTEYTLKENGPFGSSKPFNTSNLTIFAAGAFTDVIKGKTKVQKTIGFDTKTITTKNTVDLRPEDFIKYGMMTDEFMGRFQVITELNALDRETLEKILLTSTASPLKAEIEKLKQIGIKLTYEDGYIRAVAEQAVLLKTGARSLKSIIEKSVKEARFEVLMNPEIYSSIKLLKEAPNDSKAYKLYKKKGR